MSPLWFAALAAALLYLGLLSTGRKGWWKVLPAVLLSLAVPPTFAPAFLLCAVGDGCLLRPRLFLPGLGAFLLGHVAFMVAFSRLPDAALLPPLPLALGLCALAVGMIVGLWAGLKGPLKVAVPLYAVALAGMAFMSARAGLRPAFGGLLFLISDAVLAWNRFRRPFEGADGVVMVTYFGALLLLARL